MLSKAKRLTEITNTEQGSFEQDLLTGDKALSKLALELYKAEYFIFPNMQL